MSLMHVVLYKSSPVIQSLLYNNNIAIATPLSFYMLQHKIWGKTMVKQSLISSFSMPIEFASKSQQAYNYSRASMARRPLEP